jgi:hypothetical protein
LLFGAVLGTAQAQDSEATSTCVDAKVGSAESYGCLNRELQKRIPQQRPDAAMGLNAMAPAPQVGSYNQAAVREHLGTSFGKSAIPQRPPPAVFSSPLVPGH